LVVTRFLAESILPLFDTIPARDDCSASDNGPLPKFLSTAAIRQRIGKLW